MNDRSFDFVLDGVTHSMIKTNYQRPNSIHMVVAAFLLVSFAAPTARGQTSGRQGQARALGELSDTVAHFFLCHARGLSEDDVIRLFFRVSDRVLDDRYVQNPSISPTAIRRIWEAASGKYKKLIGPKLLRNPKCPIDVLQVMAEDPSRKREASARILNHPEYPIEKLESKVDEYLTGDRSVVKDLSRLAGNPRISTSTLRKIAASPQMLSQAGVKSAILNNPNCPADVWKEVADANSFIDKVLNNPNGSLENLLQYIRANPSLDEQYLECLLHPSMPTKFVDQGAIALLNDLLFDKNREPFFVSDFIPRLIDDARLSGDVRNALFDAVYKQDRSNDEWKALFEILLHHPACPVDLIDGWLKFEPTNPQLHAAKFMKRLDIKNIKLAEMKAVPLSGEFSKQRVLVLKDFSDGNSGHRWMGWFSYYGGRTESNEIRGKPTVIALVHAVRVYAPGIWPIGYPDGQRAEIILFSADGKKCFGVKTLDPSFKSSYTSRSGEIDEPLKINDVKKLLDAYRFEDWD